MFNLNTLFLGESLVENKNFTILDTLKNNESFLKKEKSFCKEFGFETLNYFSFCENGFTSLLLKLSKKGKIAISKGETSPLIRAGIKLKELGIAILFCELNKDGSVDLSNLENIDFLFLSSYQMDTFLKNDLENLKEKNFKIISNGSAEISKLSDAIYFDPYKLSGLFCHGVLLSNELIEDNPISQKSSISLEVISNAIKNKITSNQNKMKFKSTLEKLFGEDLYYFVDNEKTLENSLHFGLKGIKARELIRTLGLDEIYLSNGERCSLGLSLPSHVILNMGYEEDISRNSISLSFNKDFEDEEILNICKKIHKRYRQIRQINEGNK